MPGAITSAPGIRITWNIIAAPSNTANRNKLSTIRLAVASAVAEAFVVAGKAFAFSIAAGRLIAKCSRNGNLFWKYKNCRNTKWGARRLPIMLFFAWSSANPAHCCTRFESDTHRMRGVIRLWFALSPVESYHLFPCSIERTGLIYAAATPNASEIRK